MKLGILTEHHMECVIRGLTEDESLHLRSAPHKFLLYKKKDAMFFSGFTDGKFKVPDFVMHYTRGYRAIWPAAQRTVDVAAKSRRRGKEDSQQRPVHNVHIWHLSSTVWWKFSIS